MASASNTNALPYIEQNDSFGRRASYSPEQAGVPGQPLTLAYNQYNDTVRNDNKRAGGRVAPEVAISNPKGCCPAFCPPCCNSVSSKNVKKPKVIISAIVIALILLLIIVLPILLATTASPNVAEHLNATEVAPARSTIIGDIPQSYTLPANMSMGMVANELLRNLTFKDMIESVLPRIWLQYQNRSVAFNTSSLPENVEVHSKLRRLRRHSTEAGDESDRHASDQKKTALVDAKSMLKLHDILNSTNADHVYHVVAMHNSASNGTEHVDFGNRIYRVDGVDIRYAQAVSRNMVKDELLSLFDSAANATEMCRKVECRPTKLKSIVSGDNTLVISLELDIVPRRPNSIFEHRENSSTTTSDSIVSHNQEEQETSTLSTTVVLIQEKHSNVHVIDRDILVNGRQELMDTFKTTFNQRYGMFYKIDTIDLAFGIDTFCDNPTITCEDRAPPGPTPYTPEPPHVKIASEDRSVQPYKPAPPVDIINNSDENIDRIHTEDRQPIPVPNQPVAHNSTPPVFFR